MEHIVRFGKAVFDDVGKVFVTDSLQSVFKVSEF